MSFIWTFKNLTCGKKFRQFFNFIKTILFTVRLKIARFETSYNAD